MAFSITQRIEIRTLLGYPSRGNEIYTSVENALEIVGNSSEAQTYAEALLASLATLETQISNASAQVGLKSVDKGDIVWIDSKGNDSPTMAGLYNLGRRYITRLSILLAVPLYCDYFGTQGFPGNIAPEIKTLQLGCLV